MRADLAENLGSFSTVIIDPRAVQTSQSRAVGVIVEYGGIGERQRRDDDIAFARVVLAGLTRLLGIAAHHGAAQHLDGAFVVAGAVIDDAHLTVSVGVVGVDLERTVGVARGCHGFPHANVGVGDCHVGNRVVNPELIIEPGSFGKVFEGGLVPGFVELPQVAVEYADAVIEKGEIGSDIGSLFVPFDGEVVIAEHFVDVSLDAADIHQGFPAALAGLRDVVVGLLILELVHQDLGVIGFGEQVVIVELDGDEGFGLCLVAKFCLIGFGQVGVCQAAEHVGAHAQHFGIVGLVGFGKIDHFERLVEAVQAFLVGGHGVGRIDHDGRQVGADVGVVGLEHQRLLVGGDGFIEVAGFEMGVAFDHEGVDRAGRSGGGDEGGPDLALGEGAHHGDEGDNDKQDRHDEVGIGRAAGTAEKILAFVDVHGYGCGVAVGPVTMVGVGAGVAVGGLSRFSSQILRISLAL